MAYVYRTPGPWGPGKGANLSASEVDGNFWQAVNDIAAKAVQGVGIANISVVGNLMYVVLTDHTLLGPYELPVSVLAFRGPWQPTTVYVANDVVTVNGAAYVVLINHTSQDTFDAGANDGHGNDYYGLMLAQPQNAMPTGGVTGSVLMKAAAADYAAQWAFPSLASLSDVAVGSPITAGDVLMWTGTQWTNGVIEVSAGSSTLAGLTDVAVAAPQSGQPLVWNGSRWANASAVDLPVYGPATASGALAIDRANGEVQRFSVTGNVTLNPIAGFVSGQIGRLVLEIVNTGGFTWTWSGAGVIWPGGHAPVLTSNGRDVYALTSFDGGSTVYGAVLGQAYA